jgi:hypothetical protein
MLVDIYFEGMRWFYLLTTVSILGVFAWSLVRHFNAGIALVLVASVLATLAQVATLLGVKASFVTGVVINIEPIIYIAGLCFLVRIPIRR